MPLAKEMHLTSLTLSRGFKRITAQLSQLHPSSYPLTYTDFPESPLRNVVSYKI